ncbi:MAG: hypothetical protein IJ058_01100 [Lachnospiraceae bacterium]|nr:hypothetical protein [Lachnospiraceae bacterium]
MIKTLKTRIRIILTKLLGKDFSNPSLTRLVRDSQVISFDVFDTLIIRSGLKTPSDLFDLIHPDDSTFKSRRIEAERKAREQLSLEDIKLEEIYKELYEDLRERQEVQEAMALEISTELSVCRANPEALEFFNTVRKVGKRVVITSDMYLNRPTIENILTNCGYDLTGVNVYVSSEYGKTKRTSNLFREVLREEGMEGREGEVLHIGDNLIADYISPRKIGMKSFLYNR